MAEKIQKDAGQRDSKRERIRQIFMKLAGTEDDITSRQIDIEDDSFELGNMYETQSLLKPAYSFPVLYKWYEESDALQTCVGAMVNNVDGFGHLFQFLGDDLNERESPAAKAELRKLNDFFRQVNDTQSFRTIRKEFRKEKEIIGISGFEVVRNKKEEVAMLFHAKFKNIRMTKKQTKPVKVSVRLPRDGQVVEIIMNKFFRKFAQIETSGTTLRWFKEFGDPRIMDATTGQYKKTKAECKQVATELLYEKNGMGNEAYGLPRWIGAVLQVLGRRNAQFVNYDLFESQGIPPMAVMVSGGTLNDASLDEIETIIKSMRGIEKWNRCLLLESIPNSTSLDDKGGAKIELKNLSEYRADDQMFGKYLDSTKADIRHTFRLPDLYVGASETYTHSTSKSAQKVAEEQVFVPEREDFDEFVNLQLLVKELKITLWQFVTKGPKLAGAEDIAAGVEVFGKSAAFTINNAIEQANNAFNTQMSKFNTEWANYPAPIVLELIRLGRLKIEGLENAQLPTQVTYTQTTRDPNDTDLLTGKPKDEDGGEETDPTDMAAEDIKIKIDKLAQVVGIPELPAELLESGSLSETQKEMYIFLMQLLEVTKQSLKEDKNARTPSRH